MLTSSQHTWPCDHLSTGSASAARSWLHSTWQGTTDWQAVPLSGGIHAELEATSYSSYLPHRSNKHGGCGPLHVHMESMDTQSRPLPWHIPGACCNGSDVESVASVALNSSRCLPDVQEFQKAATDRCMNISSGILKGSTQCTTTYKNWDLWRYTW